MTEFITDEIFVLIPVLYLIGCGLKKTKIFNNKNIPIALGIISVILSAIYYITQGNYDLFAMITQGILCAGASVYGNQLWKQAR